MHIVIDILEDDYRKVQDGRASVSMMRKAIRNGTPLPKGHGRLIDADLLEEEIEDYSEGVFAMRPEFLVKDAVTIIEADKAESEVRNAT